jgi:hypothetical protein
MKLVIIESCIIKGGDVVERGAIHDTGVVKAKEDQEAYHLISAKRALKDGTPEAEAFKLQFAAEQAKKKAAVKVA